MRRPSRGVEEFLLPCAHFISRVAHKADGTGSHACFFIPCRVCESHVVCVDPPLVSSSARPHQLTWCFGNLAHIVDLIALVHHRVAASHRRGVAAPQRPTLCDDRSPKRILPVDRSHALAVPVRAAEGTRRSRKPAGYSGHNVLGYTPPRHALIDIHFGSQRTLMLNIG